MAMTSATKRTLLVLFAIAAAFYFGFIIMVVLDAGV